MNEIQITKENWREWQGGYIAQECPPSFSNKEELLRWIDQYIKRYEEIIDNDFYNMPYHALIEGWRGWRFMKQLKDFIEEGNTDEYFNRLQTKRKTNNHQPTDNTPASKEESITQTDTESL